MPKPSAAASNDDPERQLMIKTKVCQRLIKELDFYKGELQVNENQLEAMKQDVTKDRYDVQRFQDIVNESLRMVPDATRRLQAAIEDLSTYLFSAPPLDAKGLWYVTALRILESSNAAPSAARTEGIETTDTSDLKEGEAF